MKYKSHGIEYCMNAGLSLDDAKDIMVGVMAINPKSTIWAKDSEGDQPQMLQVLLLPIAAAVDTFLTDK